MATRLAMQETHILFVLLLTTTALLCALDSVHKRPSIVKHSEVQGKAPLILSELQLSRDSDSKRPCGSMILIGPNQALMIIRTDSHTRVPICGS
jgi:hypothetical protein